MNIYDWSDNKKSMINFLPYCIDLIRNSNEPEKKINECRTVWLFLTNHSFELAFSSLKKLFRLLSRSFTPINAHKIRKLNKKTRAYKFAEKTYSFSVTIKQKGAVRVSLCVPSLKMQLSSKLTLTNPVPTITDLPLEFKKWRYLVALALAIAAALSFALDFKCSLTLSKNP